MLIAIDFDGTVVKDDSPNIGAPQDHVEEVLKKLVAAGHRLILWTCREDAPVGRGRQYLSEAIQWFIDHDIELYGVNKTPIESEPRGFIEGRILRKVYADVYIDDRNLGGFPGWDVVENELIEGGDDVGFGYHK